MWLTQTYLAEPGREFPAYAYFFFNPYARWQSATIKSVRDGLRELGRQTVGKLSILMPDEDVDRREIGQELDQRFTPLVTRLRSGGMVCGLFISNLPLTEMKPDGSNARWVYLSFDGMISESDVKPEFLQFMEVLAMCAREKEGDPIARFVFAQEGKRYARNWERLGDLTSPSLGTSGLSLSIPFSRLAKFFSKDNSVLTNLYDKAPPESDPQTNLFSP